MSNLHLQSPSMMAASTGRVCGPCDTRHVTTVAVVWCTTCNEGLCTTCSEHHTASKASSQHKTLPVSQYIGLESFLTSIKLDCDSHARKFDFYCLDHNVPCCVSCIPVQHSKCKKVKSIDELSKQARKSDALPDVEIGLKELQKTIAEIQSNRQKNLNKIENQRSNIAKEINDMKLKIISYLDGLESDVLKELDDTSQKEKVKIDVLLRELKDKEESINILVEAMKQVNLLPDVHTFLASKELETMLHQEEKWATNICAKKEAGETNIKFQVEQQLKRIISEIKTFGKIDASHNPIEITVGAWKQQQAQIHIPTGTTRQLEDINLQLECQIEIEGRCSIRGCCSLPGGQMIFTDYSGNKLLVYNKDGKLYKKISIDRYPYGLTVIDRNTVAVSCTYQKMVQIIDIPKGAVKKKFKVTGLCHGISYNKGKLYVLVRHKDIEEYDVDGKFIRAISVDVPTMDGYLCCCSEGFCYTSYSLGDSNKFISHCDFKGKELWKSDVGNKGVAVDNTGNVFLTNYSSDSLFVMSSDGKRNKCLLSRDNGLYGPECVYYNKENNTLLIVIKRGKAALYRVV